MQLIPVKAGTVAELPGSVLIPLIVLGALVVIIMVLNYREQTWEREMEYEVIEWI
jgi:hypothetical protein